MVFVSVNVPNVSLRIIQTLPPQLTSDTVTLIMLQFPFAIAWAPGKRQIAELDRHALGNRKPGTSMDHQLPLPIKEEILVDEDFLLLCPGSDRR